MHRRIPIHAFLSCTYCSYCSCSSQVTGEEEIPDGVVAVLTPDAPDVLSHVSVRARNMKVLFATCHDPQPLDEIRAMAGVAIYSIIGRGVHNLKLLKSIILADEINWGSNTVFSEERGQALFSTRIISFLGHRCTP